LHYPATTVIYTLSLHDALPISISGPSVVTGAESTSETVCTACGLPMESTATCTVRPATSSGHLKGESGGIFPIGTIPESSKGTRSEEHTSELQSRFDLVCRLLL